MSLTAFSDDQLARARKRVVREREDGDWYVEGDERLGDAYPSYLVRLVVGSKKYECSCYMHKNGEVRANKVCSHVKAVVLYRAKRRVLEKARARVAQKALDRILAASVASVHPSPPPAATPSIPSPRDERFGPVPLPDWIESFRAPQWEAVEKIFDAYRRGVKFVFLNAPTGSGKSLIAELTRRELDVDALYVATTKHLQDQLVRDFPYAAVLKGRSNYLPTGALTTNLWGEEVSANQKGVKVTCADCTKTPDSGGCRWCQDVHVCPYEMAKAGALSSSLAVLNTSYFLTEANGPGRFSRKGQRGLVVLDEADLLERELMSHVEVRLSPRRQKELGINPPAKKTVEEAWSDWVRDEALPKVVQALAAMGPLAYHSDPREIRRHKSLHQLLTSLRNLRDDLPNGGWIYDYASDRQSDIAFKPIRVDKYGPSKLWAHGGTFLLMSATIISAGQMADDLGINGQGEWEVVDVPMGFPVENRRVRIVPVVEMTKATEETGRPLMAQAVAGVLKLHEDERVLVHTVSYGLAQYISDHLRRNTTRPIVTYVEGSGKDAALKKYLGTKGAVMVAPSMDRGVDLPDEACRVQVIAKVPYPYLGDKQINARRHTRGGSTWYAVETVRTLVQMCGRGVRSETDHAETYVLDHSWTTNLWDRHRRLFPQWFKDALDWKFPKHKVMGGVGGVSNG